MVVQPLDFRNISKSCWKYKYIFLLFLPFGLHLSQHIIPLLVFLNVYGIDSSLMVRNILRAQTEAYGLSLRKCFDTSSSSKSPLLRITMMLTVWKLERNYSITEKFRNVNIRCRIRYLCSIGLPYCFIYRWIDNSIFLHRLKRWKLLLYVYILSTY